MNASLVRLLLLFFLSCITNASIAQWVSTHSEKSDYFSYITTVQYLSKSIAYATNNSSDIVHTTNNWETIETIETNIPPSQWIVYIEMKDKSYGIAIARLSYWLGYDSCFVYVTENGGYTWDKVFTLPKPKPSYRWTLMEEKVFVRGYGEKLYILFGDIIAWGDKKGSNWEAIRANVYRDTYNDEFEVYADSIWYFRSGINPVGSYNNGKNWSFFDNTNKCGLKSKFQRVNNELLEEFNPQTKEWQTLKELKNWKVHRIKQISNKHIVLLYGYVWEPNDLRYAVYNRETNELADLEEPNSFFSQNNEFYTTRGTDFVRIDYDGLLESNDFGQNWKHTVDFDESIAYSPYSYLSFSKNLGVVSYVAWGGSIEKIGLAYSIDSGITWKQMAKESIEKQISPTKLSDYVLSYDLNSDLFLTSENTIFQIKQAGDSIQFEKVTMLLPRTDLSIKNVTKMDEDNFFVLAEKDDSVFLLQQNAPSQFTIVARARPYQVSTNNLEQRLVQNTNYVAFCSNKSVFAYNKTNKTIQLVSDSIVNDISEMSLSDGNELFYSDYFDINNYNLNANKLKKFNIDQEFSGKFGYPYASTSNGKGEFLWSNGGMVYTTPDFEINTLDTTFRTNQKIQHVRFWNNTYWALSRFEIYRRSPEKKQHEGYSIEKIWPNPYDTKFQICLDNKSTNIFTFDLYNALGQLVHSRCQQLDRGIYTLPFEFSVEQSGIYFFNITTPGSKQTFKLMSY